MWNKYKAKHIPKYSNISLLNRVKTKLKGKQGVVNHEQIKELKNLLSKSQNGKNFILQIGDCAEDSRFNAKKYSYGQFVFINSLALYLENILGQKVIKIGRIAGQLAKPRSSSYENKEQNILNYFGDLINSPTANASQRQADPLKMIKGYLYSKQVANYLNQFTKNTNNHLNHKIFTSHEMLLLHYEEPLTRVIDNKNYNLSAHSLWIGERTKQSQDAHVYYASLIENPIGIKVGPNSNLQDLKESIYKINPKNELGKVSIITRLGCENIDFLNKLVTFLDNEKINYLLLSDPMHGNNKLINGKKTRLVEDITKEVVLIKQSLHKLHKQLNGIHLEASVFSQNECLTNINDNIKETLCDPRLSAQQSFNLLTDIFNKS